MPSSHKITAIMLGSLMISVGRFETSTGGTDLLAQYLSKRLALNVGILIFIIDGMIICIGGLLLPADTFLLSHLTITAGGIATSLWTMKHSLKA